MRLSRRTKIIGGIIIGTLLILSGTVFGLAKTGVINIKMLADVIGSYGPVTFEAYDVNTNQPVVYARVTLTRNDGSDRTLAMGYTLESGRVVFPNLQLGQSVQVFALRGQAEGCYGHIPNVILTSSQVVQLPMTCPGDITNPTADIGALSGFVADGQTTPLAGATVTISSLSVTTIWRYGNNYSITNIPVGNYTVTVQKEGYISQSKATVIVKDSTTYLSFNMTKSTPTIDKTKFELRGQITDESGNPIDGVNVKVSCASCSVGPWSGTSTNTFTISNSGQYNYVVPNIYNITQSDSAIPQLLVTFTKAGYAIFKVKVGGTWRDFSSGQNITIEKTDINIDANENKYLAYKDVMLKSAPISTLTASLTATPPSGAAPLTTTFKAEAGGTATGTINYAFYCNRSDTGTNITTGDGYTYFSNDPANPKTTVCSYPTAGTYTAKVIIQRGSAPPAEARVQVVVTDQISLSGNVLAEENHSIPISATVYLGTDQNSLNKSVLTNDKGYYEFGNLLSSVKLDTNYYLKVVPNNLAGQPYRSSAMTTIIFKKGSNIKRDFYLSLNTDRRVVFDGYLKDIDQYGNLSPIDGASVTLTRDGLTSLFGIIKLPGTVIAKVETFEGGHYHIEIADLYQTGGKEISGKINLTLTAFNGPAQIATRSIDAHYSLAPYEGVRIEQDFDFTNGVPLDKPARKDATLTFKLQTVEYKGSTLGKYTELDEQTEKGAITHTLNEVRMSGNSAKASHFGRPDGPCPDLENNGLDGFDSSQIPDGCHQDDPNDYYAAVATQDYTKTPIWWHLKELVVINPNTNKSVVVKVRDKGPNPKTTDKQIDLSYAAYNALGLGKNEMVNVYFADQSMPLGIVNQDKYEQYSIIGESPLIGQNISLESYLGSGNGATNIGFVAGPQVTNTAGQAQFPAFPMHEAKIQIESIPPGYFLAPGSHNLTLGASETQATLVYRKLNLPPLKDSLERIVSFQGYFNGDENKPTPWKDILCNGFSAGNTLGGYGCCISSLTMAIRYYNPNLDINPGTIAQFANSQGISCLIGEDGDNFQQILDQLRTKKYPNMPPLNLKKISQEEINSYTSRGMMVIMYTNGMKGHSSEHCVLVHSSDPTGNLSILDPNPHDPGGAYQTLSKGDAGTFYEAFAVEPPPGFLNLSYQSGKITTDVFDIFHAGAAVAQSNNQPTISVLDNADLKIWAKVQSNTAIQVGDVFLVFTKGRDIKYFKMNKSSSGQYNATIPKFLLTGNFSYHLQSINALGIIGNSGESNVTVQKTPNTITKQIGNNYDEFMFNLTNYLQSHSFGWKSTFVQNLFTSFTGAYNKILIFFNYKPYSHQLADLKGTVMTQAGLPCSQCIVQIGGNVGKVSDISGNFLIQDIYPGSQQIKVFDLSANKNLNITSGGGLINLVKGRITTINLKVQQSYVQATLTASLIVQPPINPYLFTTGSAPLQTTITATAGGTATGPMNYTLWWNCSSASSNVSAVTAACGDPNDPKKGAKFDSVADVTKALLHTYATAGTFSPKVIIERSSAAAATSTAQVVVTAPSTGLTVQPSSGVAPLKTTITATAGGTATGPMKYTFWWNCGGANTAACGDPNDPNIGVTVTSGDLTKTITHIYTTAGNFYPKVIIKRDPTTPPETATTQVVVIPPTLTASLIAMPPSGAAPLKTTLKATAGGTASGPMKYTFWWNCTSYFGFANTSNNLSEVIQTCGDPSKDPNIGTQFTTSDLTKTVTHTYTASGAYNPWSPYITTSPYNPMYLYSPAPGVYASNPIYWGGISTGTYNPWGDTFHPKVIIERKPAYPATATMQVDVNR